MFDIFNDADKNEWNELGERYNKANSEIEFIFAEQDKLKDKYTITRLKSFSAKDEPLNSEMKMKRGIRLLNVNCNKCGLNTWWYLIKQFCIVCDEMPTHLEIYTLEALGVMYKHYLSIEDPRTATIMVHTLAQKKLV